MSKKKNEPKKQKEEATSKTDTDLRFEEFKQGLAKLQEETSVSIQANINYGKQGLVPYMQLVDIKEDNNEAEEETEITES